MALTIKLQSPRYDNNGNGEQIPLPVSLDTLQGTSMATILSLFSANASVLDYGQLKEVVQLVGFLTPAAATEAGYSNPVHMRDAIRRVRTSWPTEDGTLSGANWGNATLPAAEQDATQARAKGLARLVYETKWNVGGAAYENFFLYGVVGDYKFGPRSAASGRTRIPFAITFLVGSVKVG